MRRLWRPHPLAGWVDTALDPSFRPGALAAVPDHVPGVFGVIQDFPYRREGPCPDRGVVGLPLHWDRWRVAVEVGVEPVGDVLVRQAFQGPPGKNLRDHRPTGRVGHKAVLGKSFLPLGLDRMWMYLFEVAVGRLADVPSLGGVLFEAFPGKVKHLQHIPFGDRLLDPAGQYRGGVLGASALAANGLVVYAFVGGEQGDAGLFELMLDLCSVVGDTRDCTC